MTTKVIRTNAIPTSICSFSWVHSTMVQTLKYWSPVRHGIAQHAPTSSNSFVCAADNRFSLHCVRLFQGFTPNSISSTRTVHCAPKYTLAHQANIVEMRSCHSNSSGHTLISQTSFKETGPLTLQLINYFTVFPINIFLRVDNWQIRYKIPHVHGMCVADNNMDSGYHFSPACLSACHSACVSVTYLIICPSWKKILSKICFYRRLAETGDHKICLMVFAWDYCIVS